MACRESSAMVAVALAAFAWGLYWIPLRAMDEVGVTGAWSITLLFAVPAIILLPLCLVRWRGLLFGGWRLHVAGFLAGFAMVTYAGSLIYTDVVRALLLFYLTPIWSTILGRLILGEPITRVRWLTIVLGLLGVAVIVRLETGFALEFNAGDWMGLCAGIIWALAAVLLNGGGVQNGVDYTISYFIWGTVAALLISQIPFEGAAPPPDWALVQGVLPWLVPVVLILVIPPAFAIMWGATLVSPGLLAILFMTEISAGTLTAAIWADEVIGMREIAGIVLVSLAGLLEPVYQMRKRRSE
ncbi:MAG: DMT family transporter [Rhodobacteraceae bacterium]|nr:DMT family transporter [Paracoccaceae bacterium]